MGVLGGGAAKTSGEAASGMGPGEKFSRSLIFSLSYSPPPFPYPAQTFIALKRQNTVA